MEKKISFGFSKVSKKTNIFLNKLAPKEDNKIELIKCLEGQSIQLVEEKVEEAPLIIPLKDNRKTSAALLSLKTRQAVLNGEQVPAEEEKPEAAAEPKTEDKLNGNKVDDIEKRAAKELLAEINKDDTENGTGSTLVLPVKTEDLPLDGAKESTIDDYDSIPITQFGLAMLRGMGWKDQPKKKGASIEDGPIMRPKGMGLGADKALKPKALLIPPDANEILEIKKGACVRVLGGKHKDLYGHVEGLDDHAGRVIVKMALGGTKESFNEFLVQPVSKKEYAQYSKCINSAKYDEYKRLENENGQIVLKKEEKDNNRPESSHHSKSRTDDKDKKYDKVSSRRNSSEPEHYPRKTDRRSRSHEKRSEEYSRSSTSHKKYSNRRTPNRHRSKSDDSRSSDSSTYRSKHKKKSSKSKKSKKSKGKSHDRRHSSQASSEDERRHKKKTKKSKRERSRSRSKGRR